MTPWLCTLSLAYLCWAEGLPHPPVARTWGGAASVACVEDGAGALRCTVSAWGPWRALEVDGETVAGGWRVWAPMVEAR